MTHPALRSIEASIRHAVGSHLLGVEWFKYDEPQVQVHATLPDDCEPHPADGERLTFTYLLEPDGMTVYSNSDDGFWTEEWDGLRPLADAIEGMLRAYLRAPANFQS